MTAAKKKSKNSKQVLPVYLTNRLHAAVKEHCEIEDIRMSKLASALLAKYMRGEIKIDMEY